MKYKEIYVESKRSKNFQTQTVGTLVDVSNDDLDELKYEVLVAKLQDKCNKLAQEML